MKLPSTWRKRRGKRGPYYGNYYATVGGEDVNLGSADVDEARDTLRSILAQKAAEASEPDVEDVGATEAERAVPEAASPVAVPTSPPPAPAPPPATSDEEARIEAEATNAAAAETAGAPANDNATPAPALELPPEAIRGLLKQAATALVLVQVDLQGWIIKKRTGKIAGPVPADSMLVDVAAQGWVAQLEIWFPDVEKCPPWVLALGAPLLLMPQQLATATDPPPEKPAENQGSEPIQAAA